MDIIMKILNYIRELRSATLMMVFGDVDGVQKWRWVGKGVV